MNRLTLNLGVRYDSYKGTLPEQSAPDAQLRPGRAASRITKCSTRTSACGAPARPTTCSATAAPPLKTSYSRYGLQVGIDRVTDVNPLTVGNRTCPWTDPNGDGKFQVGEVNRVAVHAVQRRRLDLLRRRHQLAVLGRVHGRRRAAAPRRDARRRDVLLPHQPRPARRPQPGPADQRLHAVQLHRAQRPGRHGRQPDADDGDGLQHRPDAGQRASTTSATTRSTSTPSTRASSSPPPSASPTTGRWWPA